MTTEQTMRNIEAAVQAGTWPTAEHIESYRSALEAEQKLREACAPVAAWHRLATEKAEAAANLASTAEDLASAAEAVAERARQEAADAETEREEAEAAWQEAVRLLAEAP